jgi:hypothetical protein
VTNAFDSSNYTKTEPTELVIGDRWLWKRADLGSIYAPADYSLTYVADKQASSSTTFSITATESGSEYLIEVASATTAGYTSGTYNWQAYITRTSDSQRLSVARGQWSILANLSASTADPRSHVKKVLDAIEAVIESRASIDQMSYSIAGRSLARTPITDLLVLRDKYRSEYMSELNADRVSRGLARKNKLLVRFK